MKKGLILLEVRVEFPTLRPEPVSIGAVCLSGRFVRAAQDDASILEPGDENGCSFTGGVFFGPNIGTPRIAEFSEKHSLDRGNRVGLGVGIGKRQFKQPDFFVSLAGYAG